MLIHGIPKADNYIIVGNELNKYLQSKGFMPFYVDLQNKNYYYSKTEEIQCFKQQWIKAHSGF